MSALTAARVSFAETGELLGELAGLHIDPKQVERHTEALGCELAEKSSVSSSSNPATPAPCIWAS